ncbi:DUF1488 domain-containing protein [Leclercia adecarboxylata]|jgi:hypothetical protein|uniref:DUF1488 domain-containing protein n=1 Tax=Leclercia TaxID=83654 RepID=UPI000CD1A3DA|nr:MULTISPECIES: DUF1488 domain-containing protein [Leclercia]MCG1034677.1 DUF1488 domain-containing protein [Bacillus amyloliquefaciens]NYU11447.1 hypothetical protein [Enterobacteriaceae bacterium CCUG 67584]POV31759.1 DUF1488 domain-containing protein [Leclercia sp. LSNIH5]POW58660.1 DUF1488 domain-containing protein [Leclercia sp. LSNIH2]HCH39802.1 DUF1488 domain-containing protein [Enterobacter sp.]
MNQAIQFPDRESWDEDKQAVCFPALVNGMQMMCAIEGRTLARRFGDGLPIEMFREHRWDLEEEASDAIRKGDEDDQGWFWLS